MQRAIKINFLIKIVVTISSLLGVIISLFTATSEGYASWGKRLLYYTTISNVFLGLTFSALLLSPLLSAKLYAKIKGVLYILKYLSTVMISITLLVFTFLLFPFADESYHLTSLSSILTHFVSPTLAIIDFFTDDTPLNLSARHVPLSLAPSLLYAIFTFMLSAFKVDFGRGETYPYYFMNYQGEAGFLGLTLHPFGIGYIYPIITLSIVIVIIGYFYYKVSLKKEKRAIT